jgi:hypothetical protein
MRNIIFTIIFVLISCQIYSQTVKPTKVGLSADFVGVVTSSGMIEGHTSFTLYCEDLGREVTFNSGHGIKNPPNVSYGRHKAILQYIDLDCRECINYVVRVKAISVIENLCWVDNGKKYDIVWTPVKITLISTCNSRN